VCEGLNKKRAENNILNRFRKRIIWALQGVSVKDRVRLVLFSVLYWLYGVKIPIISRYLYRVANIVVRGAAVYYKGSKYYLIDAATTYYFSTRTHEPWMWSYLATLKKDDVFVDVGAHVGLYSIYVAHNLGSKVIAIEPHPENFNFLLKSIKSNSLRNISALNLAAWNEDTELPLYTADSSGDHSLKSTIARKHVYIVRARKLDNVLSELGVRKVSFIKIDVEGAEVEVLEGLRTTLKAYRPRLIIEVWTGNAGAVQRILKDLNYSISIVPGSVSKDLHYIYACPK
jgi:FkbM family methyltransferase